ncbi:MAG: hypothetical protein R3F21_10725 [Myxococcota bacterium]
MDLHRQQVIQHTRAQNVEPFGSPGLKSRAWISIEGGEAIDVSGPETSELSGRKNLVTRALRSQELWLTLTYLGLLLLMAKGFAS